MASNGISNILHNRPLQIMLLLIIGGTLTWYILNSAPKPKRVTPPSVVRLVDAEPLVYASTRPYWTAGGHVLASDRVELNAQVAGRVDRINELAQPGAQLAQGTLLLSLEKADFELQVQQKQAALEQAIADLKIEEGQTSLAHEEYAVAARELTKEERALVMREPQLAKAKAEVATKRAELKQAQLNLARTDIRMPFDGQIQSRKVSVGSQATVSNVLFDIVRTDRFWIEVKIPRSFLPFLDQNAQAAVTLAGTSELRSASILHVLPVVSDVDRQAVVLLELFNPLMEQVPVLASDFVQVQLPGRAFENSIVVPARHVTDDGSLWVVNNNTLQKRTPDILFRGREQVWLGEGLDDNDLLLKNRIDAAVVGMPVRVNRLLISEAE